MGGMYFGPPPERGFAEGPGCHLQSWHHRVRESPLTYGDMRQHFGGCREGRRTAHSLWWFVLGGGEPLNWV